MRKALLLCLIPSLFAHDLYLMPQKFRPAVGEKILLSAHTGDSFPGSEQSVDPGRLTALPAIAQDQWRMMAKATHALVTASVQGGQYFAIWTAPKFLEMEPDKFLDYLKEEGLTDVIRYRAEHNQAGQKSREVYAKFAKTYVVAGTPNEAFRKPLGLKIEIVPLADPALLTPGSTLPVQVLYNGKPLADTQVELALSKDPKAKTLVQIPGRTDSSGKVNITIPAAGKIRLHTLRMEHVEAADHDWESFWASLTFEVPSPEGQKSSTLSSR